MPLCFGSASALITFPSASSDLLMLPPSCSRLPIFVVAVARSLPAKSTNVSFDLTILLPCFEVKFTINTACERELCALASVGCCVRLRSSLKTKLQL